MNEKYAFGSEFLDLIVKWIGEHMEPDEVFDEGKLAAWADVNGWRPEDELEE